MVKGLVVKALAFAALAAGLVIVPMELRSAHEPEVTLEEAKSTSVQAPSAPVEKEATTSLAKPAMQSTTTTRTDAPRRDRPLQRVLGERRLLSGGTNFVSQCRYSHSAPDDPIVFPNQPGASHMHDFLGNTSTKASSTYESLQASSTTCRFDGDTAAYWTPALYDSGKRVLPTLANVYYTPGRKDNTTIQPFPAGLEVVAKDANTRVNWNCRGRQQQTRGQSTPPTCPAGTHLIQHIRFPDCWDGTNLDAPDHTSHMTFARMRSCPASHSVPVPAISLNVHYPSDGGEIVLGSPDMPVKAHADFFNAWDQPTLERFVRECINAGLHCGQRPPV